MSPEAVLDYFIRASQTLNHHKLITQANTVLALHLIGRNAEALALCSSPAIAALPGAHGWMWLTSSDHNFKLNDVDIHDYLKELMRHIEDDCEFAA